MNWILFFFALNMQGEIVKTTEVSAHATKAECVAAVKAMPSYPNTIKTCMEKGS